jgi:TRAP-type C4-dicarboxylate transport system substrate-binding protein
MGSDKDVLRKMRVGQLHGAAVAIGSLAEVYSDAQIYQVPFAFRSYDEVDYVRARMDPLIDQGLHERGLVSFGLSEGGFAYFFSRDPIRRVADLRTHKVWGPLGDEMSSIALDTVGVMPVPLTLPDVLTGLQTGVVDTVAIPPIGAIALQWHTRLRSMTDVPVMYTYGTLVLDRRTFERLRPTDREALDAVLTGVFREISAANRHEDQEARAALAAQGIELVAPVPEEVPRFRGIATEIVQRLQARGIIGADMLGRLQRHLQELRTGTGG